MSEIKFGLKLWARNYNYIDEAAEAIRGGIFDYLEVMPEAGYDTSIYPRDIRYVIHAYKFNPADTLKKDHNRSMMRLSIKWADVLNSDIIIVHPGIGIFENSYNFINDDEWKTDKRIIIENMPHIIDGHTRVLGTSPTEIKMYGRPICLDVGHMISSSVSHNVDYKAFFKDFLELKPTMAHIMDGYSNTEQDQHLGIGDGDYDITYIVNKLIEAKIQYATLETPGYLPNYSIAQLDKLKSMI
jgi:hypothetical protein